MLHCSSGREFKQRSSQSASAMLPVGFTLDIYSHVMSGIQEAAIEGLERFMAPAEAGANILAPVASAPVPTLPAGTT